MTKQSERRQVLRWKEKLSELSATVKDKNPNTALRKLRLLDQAMLESAIYGMIASVDEGYAQTVIEETMYSIFASCDNANHWRNREGRVYRDKQLEKSGNSFSPELQPCDTMDDVPF